jgi:hypothetical protein
LIATQVGQKNLTAGNRRDTFLCGRLRILSSGVSNVALHNIKGQAGRMKAIDEAVQVLRPGGRLLIADIWSTGRCRTHLAKLGMI